ncbi:type II secretion system F family protein [Paraburkholderia madseniana]|uniref:Type II secretion system F family protein n=1 Tax=Paraburkholderia madseniana TaxID=2599607 RepID=A0AAP5BQ00_9BURK|nr:MULTISPECIES: type II secretion system F family protein [Paraburkholderia]MCX4152073.1 type II secretion system F family protein [Paraburkholderia madseniana]MDN7155001.1 type II secretion system F family protein [Paraburkholderia sp. WS6]MDQ6413884.1 type II secretion system F family protein [Paraburkholderia madseniana]
MRPADVIGLGAFFAFMVGGLIVHALRGVARQQAGTRIRARVAAVRDESKAALAERDASLQEQLLHPKRRLADQDALFAVVSAWHERVRTVSGPGGVRAIYLIAFAALIASVIATAFVPVGPVLRVLACIAIPVLVVRWAYHWQIARFRNRFLAVFPDTIDLIIRAVRAGIPVVQAICVAGVESEEPVRTTFRTMGDALLVGADLKEVLEQAAVRLRLADFSFFSVCLVLQRETGGNLGDTLENLAGIVRMRRDIRAKSKALTAEGRLASKMIAAVPFALMGFIYIANRPYLDTLTHTRAGHKILALAAVLLTIGLWSINKISNLDTSR